MSNVIYFDTSALAKWYLNEPKSDGVERYIQEHGPVHISDLTVIEMRSLLSRHRREKNINVTLETQIFAAFQEDMRQRSLICHPLPSTFAAATINILSLLPEVPLRTLDALHLAIAREIMAVTIATSDRVMALGAGALGLSVAKF